LRALAWLGFGLVALWITSLVADAKDDTRRSGFHFMSPSTQAMQRDDVENPGMLWVQQGADQFARDCEACHTPQSLLAAPTRFPGWSATLKRPATLGQQIRACQTRPRSAVVQREPAASDPLAIETWLASRARGQAIQPAMDRREQRDLALGRRLYSTRLGQLGLSCADCHDALGGDGWRAARFHKGTRPAIRSIGLNGRPWVTWGVDWQGV
jgi:L-cysteine S-thiosulfotransferase